MSDKKYIVSVVGVIKKNGQTAYAGDEVTSDDFHNFDERIKGGYVTEKAEYQKQKEESDQKQKEAADLKDREAALIAYKKAFKVDAPADSSTEDVQKAIVAQTAIKAK